MIIENLFEKYNESPNSLELGIDLVYALIENTRSQEALKVIKEIEQNHPANLEVWQAKGILFEKLGDYPRAIESYYAAIGFLSGKPEAAIFLEKLGNALTLNGDPEKGIEAFDNALLLMPELKESAGFLHSVSWAYRKIGNSIKAISLLEKAIKTDSQFSDAYLALGGIFYEAGDLRKAKSVLKNAILELPQNSSIWSNLGYVLLESGDSPGECEEYFSRAISLDEKNDRAYHGLGLLYFQQEEYTDAILKFARSIELFPNYLNAIYHLGICYVRTGLLRKGGRMFVQAIRLDADNHSYWHSLGTTAFYLKKYNIALWALNQAIRIDPNIPWTYGFIADALTAQWNFEEAIRCLQDGIKNSEQDFEGREKLIRMEIEIQEYLKENKTS